MMYSGYGHNSGWMWVFGVLMIFLIVLVGATLWTVMKTRHHARATGDVSGDFALATSAGRMKVRQILDERYARGELNSDEYAERLRVLGW